jgi:hypothetical protein
MNHSRVQWVAGAASLLPLTFYLPLSSFSLRSDGDILIMIVFHDAYGTGGLVLLRSSFAYHPGIYFTAMS